MANTFGGVTLPNLTGEDITWTTVGTARTKLDGDESIDFAACKREIAIKCVALTQSQYSELEAVYLNAMGGAVALHLDSIGVDVFVRVKPGSWRAPRIRFGPGDGTFEEYGRHLSFDTREM